MRQQPDPKPPANLAQLIGAFSGVAGFILSLIKESAAVPWLKWVAWGLLALAICITVVQFWRRAALPFFRRRKAFKVARRKATDLRSYINRFLHDITGFNHTNSIVYGVRQVNKLADGTIIDTDEKTRSVRYLQEIVDKLHGRLAHPLRTMEDIRLAYEVFDLAVRDLGYEYQQHWKPFLTTHWSSISEHFQTQLIKGREIYNKFVDDYCVFRQSMEDETYGILGFHMERPDPLPGVTVKAPKPA